MNDQFNEQKEFLLSIKKEINLLQQQVDYLIRNGQPLGLLDLDVMMNRVHTLYDMMCGVEIEDRSQKEEARSQEEELPVGLEEIRSLFGIEEEPPKVEAKETEAGEEDQMGDEMDEEDEDILAEEEPTTQPDEASEEGMEENEDAYFVEEVEEEEPEPEPEPIVVEEPAQLPDVKTSETTQAASESEEEVNDFGFILNFEPVEQPEEKPQEKKPVYTTGDQIEIEIPTEDEVESPLVIGNMEDHDDNGFEIDTPETVGERYQQNQEETLGEKLQHGNVRDLQGAIGINDKFLFVNELFGGSMEKYNRSIENLNDLKTLNGALIYLNELRVELQWNSSNEAYKKLLELVHRKFES